MKTKKYSRPKITLYKLIQITREEYYKTKKKRHDSKAPHLNSVLVALVVINRPVRPTEVIRHIRESNKKFQKDDKPSLDIKSQVKYYLKELTKIKIVEKLDNGYYQLAYTVIPPPPEKNIDFYRKYDKPDLSVVLPLLEAIRDCCEQLIDYFQEEQS